MWGGVCTDVTFPSVRLSGKHATVWLVLRVEMAKQEFKKDDYLLKLKAVELDMILTLLRRTSGAWMLTSVSPTKQDYKDSM